MGGVAGQTIFFIGGDDERSGKLTMGRLVKELYGTIQVTAPLTAKRSLIDTKHLTAQILRTRRHHQPA